MISYSTFQVNEPHSKNDNPVGRLHATSLANPCLHKKTFERKPYLAIPKNLGETISSHLA